MKHIYFTALLFCFVGLSAFSQPYEYRFSSTFNELSGGPALSEVLACGAGPGAFNSRLINITSGSCGTTPQPVFDFNTGGGIAFPNNNHIAGSYTLHVFWLQCP